MFFKALAAISIIAPTLACSDGQRVTGPHVYSTPTVSHAVMTSNSSTEFWVFQRAGFTPPSVRIVLSGDNSPISGIRVAFTSSDGTTASAVTDQNGIARADGWRPDYTKSEDSVVASADSVSGTVKFKALVLHKTIIATYDLKSMGGRALPITFSGGGTSWQITGGQYLLFDDGTYVFGYEVDGIQGFNSVLPYIKRDSSVEFYLDYSSAPQSQFYANNNYLFSTGSLSGDVMTVKYTDPVDFDDETYLLRQ